MNDSDRQWVMCPDCRGQGKKARRLRKKVKLRYQRALAHFEKHKEGPAPILPKPHLEDCLNCQGSGLVHESLDGNESKVEKRSAYSEPGYQTDYPHVAIIGGGIGGVALAVACKHRGIPFSIFERDMHFDARSQGYGLTLQQASKAIEGLGIFSLKHGVVSTRHVVHKTDGTVVADWGVKDLSPENIKSQPKRTNIHIARQRLRFALLEQLGELQQVKWGHQLLKVESGTKGRVDLEFKVQSEDACERKKIQADLVVGADGIRSTVRKEGLGKKGSVEEAAPLRYLGCIVILGICPLSEIAQLAPGKTENECIHPLLDSSTVFQTANGNERIYIMPFTSDSVMWQLSFPMKEEEAKLLSEQGPQALKMEAMKRCQWHSPIPEILSATHQGHVSGYPVYDRELLTQEALGSLGSVTLIGDAAHPMSPFKGQGANQAILDALALARSISKHCSPASNWREKGIRECVLNDFEAHMLERSAVKVKASAQAADYLHSDVVLHEGNEPRGRVLLRDE